MNWFDDIEPKKYDKAGRPEKNPFPSAEVEEDFAVRGRKVIERFYVSDPASKKNFHFTPRKSMSKTAFWAFLFIYYNTKKGLDHNIQGFFKAIVKHFGAEVASDRTAISRRADMLLALEVPSDSAENFDKLSEADKRAYKKYRSDYLGVTRLWEAMGN